MLRKPLPYGPDDDTAAEIYVREALRRSQRGNWPAFLADDPVALPVRVIEYIAT